MSNWQNISSRTYSYGGLPLCVKFHWNPFTGLGGVALTRYYDKKKHKSNNLPLLMSDWKFFSCTSLYDGLPLCEVTLKSIHWLRRKCAYKIMDRWTDGWADAWHFYIVCLSIRMQRWKKNPTAPNPKQVKKVFLKSVCFCTVIHSDTQYMTSNK